MGIQIFNQRVIDKTYQITTEGLFKEKDGQVMSLDDEIALKIGQNVMAWIKNPVGIKGVSTVVHKRGLFEITVRLQVADWHEESLVESLKYLDTNIIII